MIQSPGFSHEQIKRKSGSASGQASGTQVNKLLIVRTYKEAITKPFVASQQTSPQAQAHDYPQKPLLGPKPHPRPSQTYI